MPEIEIFDLRAEDTDHWTDAVLETIDRAVPYPVFHRIHSEKGVAISAAFKRPSESDSGQWVVGPVHLDSGQTRPDGLALPLRPRSWSSLRAPLFAPLLPLSRAAASHSPPRSHAARPSSRLQSPG